MVLIHVWAGLIGLAIILYTVLDGVTLGVGLLFPTARDEKERSILMNSIWPVWDANQTWLVFGGGAIFVAFPVVYGVVFSALYIPLSLFLLGLIFRGVTFEFRAEAARKGPWNRAFFLGSLVVVLSQGFTLGGILTGITVQGNQFAGRTLDWLNPFSIMVGMALIPGYVMLASTYLLIKTEGRIQEQSYKHAFWSGMIVLVFMAVLTVWTPYKYPWVWTNWFSPPRMYFVWIFPLLGLIAAFQLARSLRSRKEVKPLLYSVGLFLSGYLGLITSLYPYAIPPTVTLQEAAAQTETLRFALWGTLIVLPMVVGYIVYSYWVFRGKVSADGVSDRVPRVLIVGGGFAGLAAAKALQYTPAHVTLIDRTNHHLFQPLLYQVAISVLSPGQIAFPIRGILRNQENATVILGEVTGVDKDRKCVFANSADRQGVPMPYDYLVLATGVRHSYFGHDEFERFAPGLKGLADAVAIRNKILQAFEQAEAEEEPARHRDLLTFVLVGAGPTGVEMAGAVAVLVRTTLQSEFRRIDPTSARIVLVDRGSRVLGTFPEDLSAAAKRRLEQLGVEVLLGRGVDQIDEEGVIIGGERISSKTVIWTAGVAPSPAGKWLGVEMDLAGRVKVQGDLTVPGHSEILVLGDTASLDQDGKPLPGLVQVALQQGRYAGKLIHSRIAGSSTPGPFRYLDRGTMAVVGKGFAVLQSGRIHLSGFIAWIGWAMVHVLFLPQLSLRVSVFMQWVWTYVTTQRGSRLIVDHCDTKRKSPTEPPLGATVP